MSKLTLILMSLHCKANVSLTLNKPKYVRVKAVENNADSYAYKPKMNFSYDVLYYKHSKVSPTSFQRGAK